MLDEYVFQCPQSKVMTSLQYTCERKKNVDAVSLTLPLPPSESCTLRVPERKSCPMCYKATVFKYYKF